MKPLLILFAATLLAEDKPPAIPNEMQNNFRASELKVQKAQAQLNLILAQEEQASAIKAIMAACGEKHLPSLSGGALHCEPKPPEVAAAKPDVRTEMPLAPARTSPKPVTHKETK